MLLEIAHTNKTTEDSRDGAVVAEALNITLALKNPTKNILKNKLRNIPFRYMVGELLWYLSANPKLTEIQKYTSAWDRMSDDGKTVNSNYGYAISKKYGFDQYEYCKKLIMKDKRTRQAVIHIKTPTDTIENPTKDLNCTVSLQFFVRPVNGKESLFMTTYMRSNDIWLGTPNDIFQFTCIQIRMAMELGLELGTYTHHIGSLHLYNRDFLALKEEAKNFSDTAFVKENSLYLE
jgi:thymidylate synthase